MNRLYLVRHGENLANLTKEFSHRLVDYPLTPKGRLQAEQTAQALADKNIHEIYSSPLRRAVETAEIIGQSLGLPVSVLEAFREVNVGELETRPVSAKNWRDHDEIIQRWHAGDLEASFPSGENGINLRRRMRAGLKQILAGKDGRNLLVIGHGGLFAFTLPDLCPGSAGDLQLGRENHNCSISLLETEHTPSGLRFRLIEWANFAHLHGEAARLVSGMPGPEEFK